MSKPFRIISTGENQDATVIKGAEGTLRCISITNANAVSRYVKVYNKASAPTAADVPVLTFVVIGGDAGGGIVPNLGDGIDLTNGIGFRITTGIADSDVGDVAAGEVVVNGSFS